METRLIIAYSLLAIMALFALLGALLVLRKRAKIRRRDAGHGDHMG